jgi:hypothetical protein
MPTYWGRRPELARSHGVPAEGRCARQHHHISAAGEGTPNVPDGRQRGRFYRLVVRDRDLGPVRLVRPFSRSRSVLYGLSRPREVRSGCGLRAIAIYGTSRAGATGSGHPVGQCQHLRDSLGREAPYSNGTGVRGPTNLSRPRWRPCAHAPTGHFRGAPTSQPAERFIFLPHPRVRRLCSGRGRRCSRVLSAPGLILAC